VNICVIGAGYVGLVSAACFAEFGWTVRPAVKIPVLCGRAAKWGDVGTGGLERIPRPSRGGLSATNNFTLSRDT
jgi:glycine/D-amino acid oxidase-like deaminating enzyme